MGRQMGLVGTYVRRSLTLRVGEEVLHYRKLQRPPAHALALLKISLAPCGGQRRRRDDGVYDDGPEAAEEEEEGRGEPAPAAGRRGRWWLGRWAEVGDVRPVRILPRLRGGRKAPARWEEQRVAGCRRPVRGG